ncbi:hypothetical protein LAZ29_19405 [Cereibacter sphaeroides]|uniref:hypothetical protein n=1 Tax=Cereibacter sphaeroides TaxID=1063 RepID=UPI001F39B5F4|nr:hypothetical protein [Cereibacter sphaeroides]MCE6953097.1 hypothetical protein [Cereibacter sphaeroides]
MALFKGSYYEGLKPFDPPEDGSAPFRGLRPRPIAAPEPILEHTVAVGDRLDALGQHYYASPRDWRRIADSNPQEIFPEDLVYAPEPPPPGEVQREAVGEVVLIPRRREVR